MSYQLQEAERLQKLGAQREEHLATMAIGHDRRVDELIQRHRLATGQPRHIVDHIQSSARRIEELDQKLGLADKQLAHMAQKSQQHVDKATREASDIFGGRANMVVARPRFLV